MIQMNRKLKLLNFFYKRNNKNRKKSSGKKRRIFASAVLAANLFFGNFKTNSFKSNPTTSSREKVVSNQEFNSLDGSYNSGKTIRTGNGTSLAFKQEVSDTGSNEIDKIILVKDAESFTINTNPRRNHPLGRPRMRGRAFDVDPPQIGNNIPGAPKARSFAEMDTGLNARKGNRGDQCPASNVNIYKEYQTFLEEMKNKGHFVDDIDCSIQRFEELATNLDTNVVDRKSLIEAKTIVQAEKENLVINARRPKKGEPNLDFVIDGPGPYKYVDVKNPKDQRKFDKKPNSNENAAESMGKKITMQKGNSTDVLHIVDLDEIPFEIKETVVNNVIKGAGSPKDIEFMN